jgi:regulator of protease activity HflC (stomatin/prohibitin superfamily)
MATAALIGISLAASAASVGTQIAGQMRAESAADKQLAESRKQEAQAKSDANRQARIVRGRAEAQAGASGITLGSFGSVFADLETQAAQNFSRLENQFTLQRDSIRTEKQVTRLATVGNVLSTTSSAAASSLPLFSDK